MEWLHKALALVVTLAILITFHELGHYLVARWCGVKVLRFSVGFGRPIWRWRIGRDQTEWAIGAIPLGGYVKMLDEREGPVPADEVHRAFGRQSVWRRIAIVSAGPLANFLLAIAIFWGMFVHGVEGMRPAVDLPATGTAAYAARFEAGDIVRRVGDREVRTWQELRWSLIDHAVERRTIKVEVETAAGHWAERRLDLSGLGGDALDSDFLAALGFRAYLPPMPAVVGRVEPGSPADAAGIRPGDRVLAIGDLPTETWDRMVTEVRKRPNQPLELRVERDGQVLTFAVTTIAVKSGADTVGRIGVVSRPDPEVLARYRVEVQYGPFAAVGEAVRATWEKSVFTLQMLWKMVIGKVSVKNLSGPLTIADYADQAAKLGWRWYVDLLALVSISLGVLNLLPVPVLDGGHLMYYAAEIIKGRPVSERALEVGQRVGLVLLLVVMAVALYNDIQRLFSG